MILVEIVDLQLENTCVVAEVAKVFIPATTTYCVSTLRADVSLIRVPSVLIDVFNLGYKLVLPYMETDCTKCC